MGNHLNIYIHQDIDYILQCNTMYTVCLLACLLACLTPYHFFMMYQAYWWMCITFFHKYKSTNASLFFCKNIFLSPRQYTKPPYHFFFSWWSFFFFYNSCKSIVKVDILLKWRGTVFCINLLMAPSLTFSLSLSLSQCHLDTFFFPYEKLYLISTCNYADVPRQILDNISDTIWLKWATQSISISDLNICLLMFHATI
jgi:hypothetical protein